ncbi:NAD(P)/FAD-dependent oxidoreductase [Cytobacillus purgationiresistens]|uniref:Glycine/D-amino acid oxidase-like deaminating enzyme n=1 Tax=Cytobacillus purgationiresistens TaxID=863449 RepID=A0ABU0AA91_9BACI|nr:FAD-dependent oxidoreductase [Cytobacillus purgationiresistens]MDQ0268169.1 glycine/D-amino acid oxidase-like deaminating enzyme [Cytobacillus purgationiresistens]
MDLKAWRIYWPQTIQNKKKYSMLEEDIECDVCIVGTGSSGAFLAYHFAQTDLKTVVVDKRNIGFGSTSANTGLLQYSNDKLFTSYLNSFGEEKGYKHLKHCFDVLEDYKKQILPVLEEDPDFIERKSLYYASNLEDKSMLEEEYANLLKYDFPVEFWTDDDMKNQFSFEKSAALVSKGDAEINPLKNIQQLFHFASKQGVAIYEDTEIVGNEWFESHVNLYTNQKNRIRAKYVIYSTGYEAQESVTDPNARIISSYAITTNPINVQLKWPEKMMIWETARPYLYIRSTVDQRIIIGGLDELTTEENKRDSKLLHKRDLLLESLIEFFPELANKVKADFYWSGFFGETHNGLPMIKQHPVYQNGCFLLTYGGNGTVYSMILSKILKDYIAEGSHPDFSLYYEY